MAVYWSVVITRKMAIKLTVELGGIASNVAALLVPDMVIAHHIALGT
jgi:hypothetical protein